VTQETETRRPVSILVVDDSAFMRNALSRMINSDPDLSVVGTAGDGTEALARITELDPDVVTLDVEMPGLGGLETLRRIMTQSPRPVIMVSSATLEDAEITFSALGAGAFDYVPKRLSSASLDVIHIQADLIARIKAASQSARCHWVPQLSRKPPRSAVRFEPEPCTVAAAIVAIGTSTGGPKALEEILPLLPADLPVPILIVQHMPAGFTGTFAQRLNTLCSLTVREATHNQTVAPGSVYIAPAGVHMRVQRSSESHAVISLSAEPDNRLHIPSINVLMESVAAEFGSLAMGVILTGMGSDGVLGMRAIHRQGGFTVGQDEGSCMVYSMPRACADAGILKSVVPLSQIPNQILQAIQYRKRA
jgi:two-component system, chemotaxis family, protein-glutamate methylesterase/glutaminase